ncbi:hypothetical protein SAMN04487913_106219 [Arthrobacter sp. ok362]|nr:hypothetical protein SAMN04487913_106219 [Arthrobacter sp. ok362]
MALGDAAQPQTVRSHRVVLDAYAFIKGWLIATSLWVGVLLLLVAAGYGVPASRDRTDAGHVWGLLGMTILYGFGVSLVVAAPLAWVLAYLQVHASPGVRHHRCLGPGSRFPGHAGPDPALVHRTPPGNFGSIPQVLQPRPEEPAALYAAEPVANPPGHDAGGSEMANDIGRFGTAPITSESEKPVERPAEEQKPYLNWGLTRPGLSDRDRDCCPGCEATQPQQGCDAAGAVPARMLRGVL